VSVATGLQDYAAGGGRPLRLETLVGLRWLAIAGQLVGVLFVDFGLGFPLPLVECLSLIAFSVAVNLWLLFRVGPATRGSARTSTIQLAYDCLQLGGLLALTGGLENPFSLLLLAPVSVSATTLPQRSTLILAGLAIVIASLLSIFHLSLPWNPDERIVFDRVYIIGIWVSLLCGTVFIAAYTNRVAHESRQLADALAATELQLSRREQLASLDGLAAAAAHELGTPLSTIALAAKEMRTDLPEGPLREDIELIISQTARCRDILVKLRNLGADGGDPFALVTLSELVAEVATPHQQGDKTITISKSTAAGPDPVLRRNVGLLYGLGNLIENAVHYARTDVQVECAWDKASVSVTITDDGPGFPLEMMTRLGDPYVSTRSSATEGGGLGLGLFIAKTLLERSGARLAFENAASSGKARVRVVWDRRRIDEA
jgi:two-component system sensor histidine kinase RegB